MIRVVLILIMLNGLFSCDLDEQKVEDCNNVICTYEYVTLWISVTDNSNNAVNLDFYKITNVSTGKEITIAGFEENHENGLYPLVADGMLEVGVEQELLFQGYINHQEVVSGFFVAKEGCCHVELISGDVNLTTTTLATDCNQVVYVDKDLYANHPSNFVTINHITLDNDCLNINFSASGCSAKTWVIKLIDSEEILESYPVQRKLRLSLKNEELCEAYLTKELSFDISNLQLEKENVIYLNVDGYNQQIEYRY